ncbi:MAG: hypothetical protein QW429_01505 [Thermoprotei archaeon]
MTLQFLELTEDPFTNNTNYFIRVLTMAMGIYAGFTSTPGSNEQIAGQLLDPQGNLCGFFSQTVSEWLENTEATAYPYAVGNVTVYYTQQIIIIPPGWTYKGFVRAIAVMGTLEEVLSVH